MKNLIHKIVTDIKFLYPCIAYEESSTDSELVIKAETKLSKIYTVKKTVDGMEAMGEDYWDRYSFKDEKGQYYCEIDGALYFKGNDIEGEPHYPVKQLIHYEFPELDKELSKFNPCIDKVHKYFENHADVKLENLSVTLQASTENVLASKIICLYTVILK